MIRSNNDHNVSTRCLDMTFGTGGHSSLLLDHGELFGPFCTGTVVNHAHLRLLIKAIVYFVEEKRN